MPLPTLDDSPGYLKAGFQGLQGSGKTFTAISLGIGVRKYFGLTGPIAMYDSETGSAYVKDLVKQHTGLPLAGVRSRSLDALLSFANECLKEKVSVLVVDSMTHIWKEVMESYLAEVNASRKSKGMYPRNRVEFQDYNIIKPRFARWTDFFLNAPMHIIICGRLGWTYEFQEDEETKRKELVKTGTKMKTEGEFGYEPSLLVEMERGRDKVTDSHIQIASIEKDRFDKMMGSEIIFRTGKETPDTILKAFMPHIAQLASGSHVSVDIDSKTVFGVDEGGTDEWKRERKQREILSEEIQALLVQHIPGQAAVDKKRKADLLMDTFGTGSWTKISEDTKSDILRDGLARMKEKLTATAETPATTDKKEE